jgi:hypothetical protein
MAKKSVQSKIVAIVKEAVADAGKSNPSRFGEHIYNMPEIAVLDLEHANLPEFNWQTLLAGANGNPENACLFYLGMMIHDGWQKTLPKHKQGGMEVTWGDKEK